MLESYVHAVIRTWLKIDDEVARALVGDRRGLTELSDLLRTAFNQHALHADEEICALLELIVEEIKYIASIRNVVAHQRCLGYQDSLMFHNLFTMKSLRKRREHIMTPAQLNDLGEYALALYGALGQIYKVTASRKQSTSSYCRDRFKSVADGRLPAHPN